MNHYCSFLIEKTFEYGQHIIFKANMHRIYRMTDNYYQYCFHCVEIQKLTRFTIFDSNSNSHYFLLSFTIIIDLNESYFIKLPSLSAHGKLSTSNTYISPLFLQHARIFSNIHSHPHIFFHKHLSRIPTQYFFFHQLQYQLLSIFIMHISHKFRKFLLSYLMYPLHQCNQYYHHLYKHLQFHSQLTNISQCPSTIFST